MPGNQIDPVTELAAVELFSGFAIKNRAQDNQAAIGFDGVWQARQPVDIQAGEIDWRGDAIPLPITWGGPPGRCCPAPVEHNAAITSLYGYRHYTDMYLEPPDAAFVDYRFWHNWETGIYCAGKKIEDAPGLVVGAAARTTHYDYGQGPIEETWLLAICGGVGQQDKLYRKKTSGEPGDWELLETIDYVSLGYTVTPPRRLPIFFNPAGTQAISLLELDYEMYILRVDLLDMTSVVTTLTDSGATLTTISNYSATGTCSNGEGLMGSISEVDTGSTSGSRIVAVDFDSNGNEVTATITSSSEYSNTYDQDDTASLPGDRGDRDESISGSSSTMLSVGTSNYTLESSSYARDILFTPPGNNIGTSTGSFSESYAAVTPVFLDLRDDVFVYLNIHGSGTGGGTKTGWNESGYDWSVGYSFSEYREIRTLAEIFDSANRPINRTFSLWIDDRVPVVYDGSGDVCPIPGSSNSTVNSKPRVFFDAHHLYSGTPDPERAVSFVGSHHLVCYSSYDGGVNDPPLLCTHLTGGDISSLVSGFDDDWVSWVALV